MQIHKEMLQLCILAMLHKDGEMYGYEIASILMEQANIKQAHVYDNLRKMKRDNLIEQCSVEKSSGRLRIYYNITQLGEILRQKLIEAWQEQNKLIEYFV